VHYLLLKGAETPLRDYYASLGGRSEPDDRATHLFRAFCLDNAAAVTELIESRLVQTNEVARSACLMPAFAHVASLANGPIALLEVGASAGLNLLPDAYFYDYGDLGKAGDPASPVRLRCEVTGGYRPPIEAVPAIAYRAGVDLNPIDVRDADAVLWLRALIWPEHEERAAIFQAAVALASADPPRIRTGDGIEMAASLVNEVPQDLTVCVFHSFVMNQVGRQRRERFYELLAGEAWKRPIFDLSFESTNEGVRTAAIEMSRSVRGEWRRAVLAKCQAHGSSIEWLLR
jgi:hypothetical protein